MSMTSRVRAVPGQRPSRTASRDGWVGHAPVHWGWLLGVAALAAYGSLYPFRFAAPTSFAAAWGDFVRSPHWWTSWSDVLGNVLLFVPIGMAIHASAPARWRAARPMALALAIAAGFALALQIGQIWVPSRSAALSDVVWNTVGCLLGVVASPVLVRLWQRAGVRGLGGRAMPLVLVGLWLLAELAPLVPALNWQGIKDALRPLRNPDAFSWSLALASAARTLALGTAIGALRNGRGASPLLLAAVAATAIAKPFVVGQALTAEDLAGYGAGFALWLVVAHRRADTVAIAAATLLFVTYSLDELRPFTLAPRTNPINWIPFSAVLGTMSAANLAAIFRSLFTFSALLWLVCRDGGMHKTTAAVIAAWVALLEIAQQWIDGRSADMTEPVLALVAGAIVSVAARVDRAAPPGAMPPVREPDAARGETTRPAPRAPGDDGRVPRGAVLAFVASWLLTTVALAAMLRVPGIPYNVAAMFLGGGHLVFLAIFALATLWIGIGAAWVAQQVRDSRWPIVAWPGYAGAAAMVCLVLLYASVTDARIEKLSGSNNLFWFVTNKDIWGAFFRGVFAFVGRDVEIFLERPVRFAALYLPPTIFVATALMLVGNTGARRPGARGIAIVMLSALPVLWLCKAIAFDWSSTDNLNELIARDGPYGIGGGGYLYGLLALFAANVALLARLPLRPAGVVAMAIAIAIGIGAGWSLLDLGLEPRVEKYGLVFPAAQFLLGPDRKNLLPTSELMARWAVVYFAAVVLVAVGARVGWPIARAIGERRRPARGPTPSEARAP